MAPGTWRTELKLLLDEMYGARLAVALRGQGWDVVATQERPQLRGAGDREILAAATSEGRAVVTENVGDFVRLFSMCATSGERHAGIILVSRRRFPRTAARPAEMIGALDTLLRAHQDHDALRDGLRWL
ncbi:MAG: hypothetical protein NVSMB8_06550 [Candidatus Limnocylindrales bacterium]